MIVEALRKLNLFNVRVQISANLESGEEIHVMNSDQGWHVGFGERSPYNAPEAVDESEAAQIIGGA